MEGSAGRLSRSLRFRLCLYLSLFGMVFAAYNVYRTYQFAMNSVSVYIDEEISQIAQIIVKYDMLIPKRWERTMLLPDGRLVITMPKHRSRRSAFEEPSLGDLFSKHQDISIAPLFAQPGETFYLPISVEDGFYTVLINDNRVRVYVATNASGLRFVVARPLAIAEELVAQSVWHSLWRFLMLIALYVPAVILIVNIMFRKVNKLASEISGRSEQDLSPLKGEVPSELDVFISSLNRLLVRIGESLTHERRFIADAAHELRTPLTAISLQAETFRQEGLDEEQQQQLSQLRQAISRQRKLTTDLLTLARSQLHTAPKLCEFALRDLFVELIEELDVLAEQKNIDLGIEGEVTQTLKTDRGMLKTMLQNLISNAVKYTQAGGRCDLKASEDDQGITILVEDNGPGVAEEHLAQLVKPFYRVDGDQSKESGTGLGLAIVAAAAAELNAELSFKNRTAKGGLCCELRFKKQA
ncbi:MAG: HAMP domain-containing histidine kinase [Succinivibrio sp.]|nr:HAMP domain-containing histidine kinase [Succinivibrio sp.]